MQYIPAGQRYEIDFEWLKGHYLFSFGDYLDHNNLHHGMLRVFNDDHIAPHSGFPMHPHANMEIATIVLSGAITHEDSMGNRGRIKEGQVQVMSAGSGVVHSEYNNEEQELHSYQLWFYPRNQGNVPRYDQMPIIPVKNGWTLLLSGDPKNTSLYIDSDVEVRRGVFTEKKPWEIITKKGSGAFIYVTKGAVSRDGTRIGEGDQLRVGECESLSLEIQPNTDIIYISTILS